MMSRSREANPSFFVRALLSAACQSARGRRKHMRTKLFCLGIGLALAIPGCAMDAGSENPGESTGGLSMTTSGPSDSSRSQSPKMPASETLSYPASHILDVSETQYIVEPEGGTRIDDGGHTYTDNNYWNFCGPGAEAVVLYYSPWRDNPKYGTSNTYYKEPYGPHVSNTFWTSP